MVIIYPVEPPTPFKAKVLRTIKKILTLDVDGGYTIKWKRYVRTSRVLNATPEMRQAALKEDIDLVRNGLNPLYCVVFGVTEEDVEDDDHHLLKMECLSGNVNTVKFLVHTGNLENILFEDSVLLHFAIESTNLQLVKYIVKNGVTRETMKQFDNYAINRACELGRWDIVNFFQCMNLARINPL